MQSTNVLSQQSPQEFHWQAYFERFGCLACGERSAPHDHGGFCERCRNRIIQRLRLLLRLSR